MSGRGQARLARKPQAGLILSAILLLIGVVYSQSATSDLVSSLSNLSDSNNQISQIQVLTDPSAVEAAPQSDTYSVAPLVQDDSFAYFMTQEAEHSIQTFNQEWKSLGLNQFGSSGGWLGLNETFEIQGDGVVQIRIQVTAFDSGNDPEPWVHSNFAGNGYTEWRLDLGRALGGNNSIQVDEAISILDSGVAVYDSSGKLLSDLELNEVSSSAGNLSGLAIAGLGGEDIAGYDLATMIMYWTVEMQSDDTGFEVTGGQSGAWYDPSHEGEGYVLQIISPTQAVVYWFTYDSNGNQYWMIGVGEVNGSKVTFSELLSTSGGKFGPDFDPNDVEYTVWGTLEFNFQDCNHATATYSGPPAFGSGTLNVTRLSSIWGVGCNGNVAGLNGTGDGFLSPGFSGSWYDVRHEGEGFTLEVLNETTALIYWFTYDTEGNQAWMLAVGEIIGATIFATDILITSGGKFGPNFDPADVNIEHWGAAAFSFGSCVSAGHGGAIRYLPPPEFGLEGTQLLSRLVFISGIDCEFLSNTYDITGSVKVGKNIFVDGDTNNPEMEERPNDLDEGEPGQLVPPAQVAGFVTADATGVPGDRFESESDEWDIYLLPLQNGEGLTLTVSDWQETDPESVDLDLYLVDVNTPDDTAASSLTTNQEEIVFAPHEGNYWVYVHAYSGQSSYLLRSGQSVQASSSAIDVSASFAPGQVIASLHDVNTLTSTSERNQYLSRIEKAEKKNHLYRLEVSPSGDVLYGLDHIPAPSLVSHPLSRAGIGSITPDQWLVAQLSKSLSSNPDFQWAGPNYVYRTNESPNDSFYPFQWHYDLMRLPDAWDITRGTEDIVVAVLDTGVFDHPDLASNVNYALGYDFVSSQFNSGDGDGIDGDARDPGKLFPADRPYISHGTHVAGTIGAATDNNSGVSGVNWNSTIMPVRVLGLSGGTCFDINEGLRWAGRLSNASGQLPSVQADIVNMSLGGSAPCPGMQNIINQLSNRDVIVIASAGNDGNSALNWPATFEHVISVSATTFADDLAYYSSFGTGVDIAAPGGDMTADLNGDSYRDGVLSSVMFIERGSGTIQTGYSFSQGTSMAAPHVAGVAGLMKAAYPNMGPDEFHTAIASGDITVDLAQNGPTIKDSQFGYGRMDALNAVQWAVEAEQGQTTEAFLTASSASLDFADDLMTMDLLVGRAGDGNLTLANFGWSEPWMSVSALSVGASGFGTYRVSVDRNGLLDGQYTGWIAFDDSNGARLWVSVLMRVGESLPGNAEYLVGILLDEWTLQTVKSWDLPQDNESVDFEFPANTPGNYFTLVSTDIDNDFEVCDSGELCEFYPTNSTIERISVGNQDVQLGQFRISFPGRNVGSSSDFGASMMLGDDAGGSSEWLIERLNFSESAPGIRRP